MRFRKWFCENILGREYPLIQVPWIPRSNVPYITFPPIFIPLCSINLTFNKWTRKDWSISDDGDQKTVNLTISVIEHEYLHLVLKEFINFNASSKFNNVNRFSIENRKLVWQFRDGKTFGHLTEKPKPKFKTMCVGCLKTFETDDYNQRMCDVCLEKIDRLRKKHLQRT